MVYARAWSYHIRIAVLKCGNLIFVSAVIRYGGNFVRFAGDVRCISAAEPVGTLLMYTRSCSVLPASECLPGCI